jgi:hypothetical protein
MVRCTVTDVAWPALAQPAAGGDAAAAAADGAVAPGDPAGADDVAPDPAALEAVTEPHPASAEHSSTARTVPRTWRGDIMPL